METASDKFRPKCVANPTLTNEHRTARRRDFFAQIFPNYPGSEQLPSATTVRRFPPKLRNFGYFWFTAWLSLRFFVLALYWMPESPKKRKFVKVTEGESTLATQGTHKTAREKEYIL